MCVVRSSFLLQGRRGLLSIQPRSRSPRATGDDQQLQATAGEDYQLPVNMFTVPEGRSFAGWKDTNTGTVYKELAIIPKVDKDYTFEAQWKKSGSGGDSDGGFLLGNGGQ